jgi:T-complex protein 1 subunit gamma
MQAPVMVMNTNSKRETGRKAQLTNIQAAKVSSHLARASALASSPLPINLGCV